MDPLEVQRSSPIGHSDAVMELIPFSHGCCVLLQIQYMNKMEIEIRKE